MTHNDLPSKYHSVSVVKNYRYDEIKFMQREIILGGLDFAR